MMETTKTDSSMSSLISIDTESDGVHAMTIFPRRTKGLDRYPLTALSGQP